MIFLNLFVCALLFYIVFSLGPSVVAFFTTFYIRGRKPKPKPEPKKEYYEPFLPLLQSSVAHLKSLPTRELCLTARDGTLLKADYIDGGFSKTAILIHGFRATPMSNCAYHGVKFWEQGYNVLLVHQRAHGKSGGRISTLGLLEQYDILDWIDCAASQPNVEDVVAYGISMGAAALGYASDKICQPKLRAIVIDCGFASFYHQLKSDCKKRHVPGFAMLPWMRLFYRWRFHAEIKTPVADSLKNTQIPAFFLHGKADKSVCAEQGEMNFAACASPKELLLVDGADHTCALLQGGEAAFHQVLCFINRYVTT